ncbi:unnamed protein product [Dovyalis caffra]|uniref:Serine-tRNA synthetase type1 N-terminal domain-containing protein n=1 Tax=Dovyalis caffra TaxID=77055 RepID=A0AAV1RJP9_9ROSI|nr:unnamed protein product [Dovyalis caffra]
MLDINCFAKREATIQRKYASQFELDNLRREFNKQNKRVAQLKIAKEDATEAIKDTEETKKLIADKEKEVQEAKDALYSRLSTIGNLVRDSVPFDNNEDNNAVIRAWGEKRVEKKLRNHVDLVELLGIADLKKGADVAGGRGFYLKVDGVRLNQALINFGLEFLEKRGYTALQTPFFMRKDAMAKCAQLAQFDEELYKEGLTSNHFLGTFEWKLHLIGAAKGLATSCSEVRIGSQNHEIRINLDIDCTTLGSQNT